MTALVVRDGPTPRRAQVVELRAPDLVVVAEPVDEHDGGTRRASVRDAQCPSPPSTLATRSIDPVAREGPWLHASAHRTAGTASMASARM